MSNRTWQSINNKAINFILQTFRHKNIGVIFTMPNINFIDLQARNLLHAYMEMKQIYRSKNLSRVKYMYVDQRPDTMDFIRKYPRKRIHDGKIAKIKSILVPKPAEKYTREYEKKKKEFSKNLSAEMRNLVEREVQKRKKKEEVKKEITRKCKNCNYEWGYKGNALHPTCPSCRSIRTTKIKASV